ncbi:nucleolar protein 11-like [Pholidichthys leucotaenia]
MAALYEGCTLCELVPDQTVKSSGIQGIEQERGSDHIIVTNSTRSVTLYKVSDQKPLGSWTIKQGQTLSCPAVFNTQTGEYVAVTDNKVVRIWKEEDVLLDKAYKATVSSDIWRVHCSHGGQPVVLFHSGAVRLLESLLSAPQQPIEEVLAEEETMRWSTNIVAEMQQFLIFATEQKGNHFLYLQRLNPNSLQKYQLEKEKPGLSPLSFSASYRNKHICLLYLYPNGQLYQSLVPVQGGLVAEEGAQALPLPRNLLLGLPVGEGVLEAASAMALDEAHVAVVGVPHPSAGASKDFLCIWNTNFQTLQAGKEMAGKLYGQLWCYSNKVFIPHGRTLSVIPFECPKSSLASALGKLRNAKTEEGKAPVCVPSWNNILHGEIAQPKTVETRKTRTPRKTQTAPTLTVDQVLELIKTAPVDEVQKEVEGLLSRADLKDLQPSVGQLAAALVSRSLTDPVFYSSSTLVQLVHTRCLCHSICPDLVVLALEKKDYFLCQLCLQFLPDIPEAITCACLKAFISIPDEDAEKMSLEPESVSFMELLISREPGKLGLQNGFGPTSLQEDRSDDASKQDKQKPPTPQEQICPVGLHKAVLLNEILQTAYSDTFLLPHLKDFASQQVVLFLQYLQFLYLKYSQNTFPQMHGIRSPSLTQIMDWVCLVLDAHFTVLVMTPEAKGLLLNLHKFVKLQVKLVSELGKIESSFKELNKLNLKKDAGQYSIEVIELF